MVFSVFLERGLKGVFERPTEYSFSTALAVQAAVHVDTQYSYCRIDVSLKLAAFIIKSCKKSWIKTQRRPNRK